MVTRDDDRARYVTNSEGAPPVPPPGGYRGARRAPASIPGAPTAVASLPDEPRTSNVLGRVALIVSIVFAVVLLIVLAAGGADALYGVTMLALQLIVAGVVIAALVTARGRRLGAIALSVALVFNTATVGAIGAVQTSASGNYEGLKTDEQKHEEAYPGIKDVSSSEILAQPSLEEVRERSEAALEEMKRRLTERYGYTWVPAGDEDLRPERNGYGGESMLVQYISQVWGTAEPIQDYEQKLAVMDVIDEVLYEYDMWGIISLNDPDSGLDPKALEMLYGSSDPMTQDTWEWYSNDYPGPRRFYAVINDLSHDENGEFRTSREAQSAQTGEPIEGLQIYFLAPQLLSEADRAEFEERLEEYPGY